MKDEHSFNAVHTFVKSSSPPRPAFIRALYSRIPDPAGLWPQLTPHALQASAGRLLCSAARNRSLRGTNWDSFQTQTKRVLQSHLSPSSARSGRLAEQPVRWALAILSHPARLGPWLCAQSFPFPAPRQTLPGGKTPGRLLPGARWQVLL